MAEVAAEREAVLDASAMVDLLLDNAIGRAVGARVAGHGLHGPAHLDAEVLSALGRLHRAGTVAAEDVDAMLADLATAPLQRHPVADLVVGAWGRRHQLRLADALSVELAAVLGLTLVSTDRRLRDAPGVDVVTV